MLSLILSAAVLAAEPAPREKLIPVVLVTTDGRSMRVRGYEIDGAMVKITSLDGKPQIMRAEKIDLEKTEAATAEAVAAQAAEEQAQEDAAAQAEAKASARAEARAKAALQPRRRGGMTIAGGSAKREVELAQERAGMAADAKEPAAGSTWKARLEWARGKYHEAKAERDAIKAKLKPIEDANSNRHMTGELGRFKMDLDMAGLKQDLGFAEERIKRYSSAFNAAAAEGRAAGADPGDLRPLELGNAGG